MFLGMRPPGNGQELERRRRRAISLLRSGKSHRAVASMIGSSLSSVVRWHQAWRKQGAKGLRTKPIPGRPSGLSEIQKKKLKRLLLKGPQEAGYSTNLWTLKRMAAVIEAHCGRRYHAGHVWRILRKELEWSWQKPEKRATQRDEKAIARWKRGTWLRIKKSATA